MKVSYIHHKEIDKKKWDRCIVNAVNHFVYAESWYLDIICAGAWDALILNDYEAVMPLPFKRKYILKYVQQPIWAQQLGIFSTIDISTELLRLFFRNIPSKYGFVSLNLNERNYIPDFHLESKVNLVLPLKKTYPDLSSSYSTNTKRNLAKSKEHGLDIAFDAASVSDFMLFFEKNKLNKRSNVSRKVLSDLVQEACARNSGKIVLAKYRGKTVAASFVLISEKRLIYRVGVSSPEGKEKKAMFLLVDALIKKHAGSDIILDFEGSSIKGVRRFYEGFGGVDEPYYYYKKYNNKLLRYLKR